MRASIPDYEFAYDRIMSEGDVACHWAVRKKVDHAKAETKEKAPKIVRI